MSEKGITIDESFETRLEKKSEREQSRFRNGGMQYYGVGVPDLNARWLDMKDLTPDFINNGIKNAQNNTWSDRYTNVMPAVKFNGATITYSTSLKSVDITPLLIFNRILASV